MPSPVSMRAYTRPGLLRAICADTLPTGGFGRPCPVSRVQVSPPSAERNRPLPGPPLARARPDNVRIGGRDGQRSDRRHVLIVEDRIPMGAGVGGFEKPA